MIKHLFFSLSNTLTSDKKLIKIFWDEIELAYFTKNRHYHTMKHLEEIVTTLEPLKDEIVDWNVIIFATVYHDIVYDVNSYENEKNSALFAKDRLYWAVIPRGMKVIQKRYEKSIVAIVMLFILKGGRKYWRVFYRNLVFIKVIIFIDFLKIRLGKIF